MNRLQPAHKGRADVIPNDCSARVRGRRNPDRARHILGVLADFCDGSSHNETQNCYE